MLATRVLDVEFVLHFRMPSDDPSTYLLALSDTLGLVIKPKVNVLRGVSHETLISQTRHNLCSPGDTSQLTLFEPAWAVNALLTA